MTYRDALWTAIIGEFEKYGNRKVRKKLKRDRINKLVNYWRKTH